MVLNQRLYYVEDLVPFEGECDFGVLQQGNERLNYLIDEIKPRRVDQDLVENVEDPADGVRALQNPVSSIESHSQEVDCPSLNSIQMLHQFIYEIVSIF